MGYFVSNGDFYTMQESQFTKTNCYALEFDQNNKLKISFFASNQNSSDNEFVSSKTNGMINQTTAQVCSNFEAIKTESGEINISIKDGNHTTDISTSTDCQLHIG